MSVSPRDAGWFRAPDARNDEDSRAEVLTALDLEREPEKFDYGPNDAVSPDFSIPYPPDIDDLARLYTLARHRRAMTILEFGSGYSTAVLARALEKNRRDFADTEAFKALRRNNPFELHTLDCSFEWLRMTYGRIPEDCRSRVHIHHSTVSIGLFNDRLCHFYDNMPNVCPDFIYLDGPSQHDAQGHIGGVHFRHNDRTVVAADLARMEWLLLPGTLIVVDGRTNNARFLKANFQRAWAYQHDKKGDVHLFELVEEPLGDLNRRQVEFCLGEAR